MMDTQETNLPKIEEVGLEETKVPETTPESTTEDVAEVTGTVEAVVEEDSVDAIAGGEEPEEAIESNELTEDAAEVAGTVEAVVEEDSVDAIASVEEPEEAEAPNELTEDATEAAETVEAIVEEDSVDAIASVEEPEEANELIEEAGAASEEEATAPASSVKLLSKDEILGKLETLVHASGTNRVEIDSLKQAFYRIHRLEVDELKAKFLEEGGDENAFKAPEDEKENRLKEILSVYREKKASQHAEEEQLKAANYALKLQLIDRLKELTESQEDFNKLYNEFKEIQQRWKETRLVPQEYANELWKNYQVYSERFYDLIKINNQFRDYDFKKNLEIKNVLCDAVEKLQEEKDIVNAFHKLQKLHQQWRETGPVAKDLREEVWGRFKTASLAINKRHQSYYEEIKATEDKNLQAKTAVCVEVESIDYTLLTTLKDWDAKQKEVLALQDKWKTIGYTSRKHNTKIYERFRKAVDVFFKHKTEFSKGIKGELDKNYELKKALCEKAEALKDSKDWKETTDKLIALQKEWKAIGTVPRKHAESIWKRFISACDYFFEQKNLATSSQRGSEQTNLAAKKEVIAKVKAIDETLEYNEAIELLKGYMSEWNATGFVPFKEKDKLHNEYHEAVEAQYSRLKVDKGDRKLQTFRNNMNELGEKGKGKLYGERDKLMRTYDRLKSDLQTYENNIGFLSIASKGGGGLVKEMEQKKERLKEEMQLLIKKIEAIDENLE